MQDKNNQNTFCEYFFRYWYLLLIWGIVFLFKETIYDIVDSTLLPYADNVEDTVLSQIVVLILTVIIYLANIKDILEQTNWVPKRLIFLAFAAILFYSVFRYSDHYTFYGVIPTVSFADSIFYVIFIIELALLIYRTHKRRGSKLEAKVKLEPFFAERPTEKDECNRKRCAEILRDKIIESFTQHQLEEGAFTILFNERYGAGKSSFFEIFNDTCKKSNLNLIEFKPWLFSNSDDITKGLLKILSNHFDDSDDMVEKLFRIYSTQMTAHTTSNLLYNICASSSNGIAIENQFDNIKVILAKASTPLVIVIDDVDRLQSNELLSLLKLIRNTADFPNIVYIIAADKTAISTSLNNVGINNADIYLQKFFNFEMLFPSFDNSMEEIFISKLSELLTKYGISRNDIFFSNVEIKHINYLSYVFKTYRDLYRFLNLVTYTFDTHKQSTTLSDLYIPDLIRILIIQYLDSDVYKILRDNKELLLSYNVQTDRLSFKAAEYRSIILPTEKKQQIKQLLENTNNNTTKKDDVKDEYQDLQDIIDKTRPTKQDIISDILNDLFADSINYQTKLRICFESEYFKYFAGEYSKQQISNKRVCELVSLPKSEFESQLALIFRQDQGGSLIHKLEWFVEEHKEYDKVDLLPKLVDTFKAIYNSHLIENPSLHLSKIEYWQGCGVFRIINRMYEYSDGEEIVFNKSEIEHHENYISNTEHLEELALFFSSIRPNDHYHFIYGDELLVKWKESIINRFIKECLTKNPFSEDNISAIISMDVLYPVYWNNQFKALIQKSKNPSEWLYRFITIDTNGNPGWNYSYIMNLCQGSIFKIFVQSMFKDLVDKGRVDKALYEDMLNIHTTTDTSIFYDVNIGHHPFVLAAIKWWKKHNKAESSK